jgi:hypothetical protein
MRLDRFTERSQEALQAAQRAAQTLQHAMVEPDTCCSPCSSSPRAWRPRCCDGWRRSRNGDHTPEEEEIIDAEVVEA